jgi:tetratricopeptide (TPR) repeat protein
MTQPIDFHLERLRRLPRLEGEVWQFAVARMPQWVVGESRPPYRPLVPLSRSVATGLAGFGELYPPEEAEQHSPFDALGGLAGEHRVHHAPSRIEVRDPRLAERLREPLAPMGIEVVLVDELPLIDQLYADMIEDVSPGEGSPGYLEGQGVTVERLRAFADAAAAFHRAAPWNALSDLDLVSVESPVPDPRLKWLTTLGASGVEYGIGFHPSERDHERMLESSDADEFIRSASRWMVTFHPEHEIPIPDSDLWEAHRLPVAGESAFPFLFGHEGTTFLRADAAVMACVEGILRAMAASSEDDVDRGRWTQRVRTFDGEQTVALALPALLGPRAARTGRGDPGEIRDRRLIERTTEDLRRALSERKFESVEEANQYLASLGGHIPHRDAITPEERAQDLYYEALESRGRRRVKLAREALREWPDCADARVLLAEEMPDLTRRADLYRQALASAERTLGKEPFEEEVGHFWGIAETRPYMRARFGLAISLWGLGQEDEAVVHCRELLRLDPDDHQAVRFFLVPRLLMAGRDDDARQVLAAFEDDRSASMMFARALVEFRTTGEERARPRLEEATKLNPHVQKYLMGSARLPRDLPAAYGVGSDEEAIIAAADLIEVWQATPGAVEWLKGVRRQAKRERKDSPRRRRGKR